MQVEGQEQTQEQVEQPVVQDENAKVLEEFKKDFFKVKEERNQLAEKLQSYEERLTQAEQEKLKEQNKWQELAQLREKEANEFKEKYSGLQRAVVDEKKYSAIEKAALKKGVDPEYLAFVRDSVSSEVDIETTSAGNVNILGADESIEVFLSKYPKFKVKGDAPNINNGNPSLDLNDKRLSPKEILELQKKDPGAYASYIRKAKGFKD